MPYKSDELRFRVYASHADMCAVCNQYGPEQCPSHHKPTDYVLVAAFSHLQEAIDYAQNVSTGERGVTVRLRSQGYGENAGYNVSEYSPKGVKLGMHDGTPKPKAIKLPKVIEDKRLVQDRRAALDAIACCNRALANPFYTSGAHMGNDITEAICSERARLMRALLDTRLLWSIYRRADKSKIAPYSVETRASHLLPQVCWGSNSKPVESFHARTVTVETRQPAAERMAA